MGLTVKCASADHTLCGTMEAVDCRPPVMMYECRLSGPDLQIDMTWLDEVEGLEKVVMKKIHFEGGHYGRKELAHLIEGRTVAVIKGCRICRLPIDGADGAPDVCPDELSHRCVLTT